MLIEVSMAATLMVFCKGGEPRVDPDELEVGPNEALLWTAKSPFRLEFKEVDLGRLDAERSRSSEGEYQYAMRSSSLKTGKNFYDVDVDGCGMMDPVIIVRER